MAIAGVLTISMTAYLVVGLPATLGHTGHWWAACWQFGETEIFTEDGSVSFYPAFIVCDPVLPQV